MFGPANAMGERTVMGSTNGKKSLALAVPLIRYGLSTIPSAFKSGPV